jgi:hypothetical protein
MKQEIRRSGEYINSYGFRLSAKVKTVRQLICALYASFLASSKCSALAAREIVVYSGLDTYDGHNDIGEAREAEMVNFRGYS